MHDRLCPFPAKSTLTAALFLLFFLPFAPARAQLDADFRNGGGIVIGTSATTCDAAAEGGIRYSSVNGCAELCDGLSWNCLVSNVCDSIPASFSFTGQHSLATSTQYSSDIVLITGMDAGCEHTASISGQGSPQYRICSTSNCSAVTVDWTATDSTLAMEGKYLQLRATTSASAGTTHTITASAGSVSNAWTIKTTPTNCYDGEIGTVCADGSVYAGTTPDGSVPFYVTRCDAEQTWDGSACTGIRALPKGNNGQNDWTDTTIVNCGSVPACDPSGESNTAILISEDSDSDDPGIQTHDAAQYCADLNIHGQTDWYLPSAPELNILHTNKTAIGNFRTTNPSYFWSSSEVNNVNFWIHDFYSGAQSNAGSKWSSLLVRCARK